MTNGAPVCADLNRDDFYANATRVSTFGFYRATVQPIGATDCSDEPGPYAGCMTAPCAGPVTVNTDGTATIHCDCPIFDGPFQLGKSGLSCDDAPMAWSAAYNPNAAPPNPCDMVARRLHPRRAAGPVRVPALHGDDGAAAGERRRLQQGVPGVHRLPEVRHLDPARLHLRRDAVHIERHTLVFDACLGLQTCDLTEIFKAESAAECSCCASQLCNCDANSATEQKIYELDAAQRAPGETPQCDINGTLCGEAP